MKIRILNPKLTSERVYGVRFPFPPISIPTNDAGEVCLAEQATRVHYSTIVLLGDEDNVAAILEFPPDIFEGLAAYAKRHRGLSGIEVLLSRELESGKIRVRIGTTYTDDDVQIMASPYQQMYDGLYSKYMSKLGKKLNDTQLGE